MGKRLLGLMDIVSRVFFEDTSVTDKCEYSEPYGEYLENHGTLDPGQGAHTPLNIDILLFTDKAIDKGSIDSVIMQSCTSWELYISGTEYAYMDDRIHSMGNMDISVINEMLYGDYILIMSDGDRLCDGALTAFISFVSENGLPDAVYADEDILSGGVRTSPVFKPCYSPDMLLSANYIGRPFFVKKAVYEKACKYIGSSAEMYYSYVLSVCRYAKRILHIPEVLLTAGHKGENCRFDGISGFINDTLYAEGRKGFCVPGLYPGSFRVHYEVKPHTTAQIVLYNISTAEQLGEWLEITDDVTSGKNHFITIAAASPDIKLKRFLTALSNSGAVKTMICEGDIKLSDMLNRAASSDFSDNTIFCDCGFTPAVPDWIEAMTELASQKRTGTVSPLITTADGRITEAGNIVGLNGFFGVPYYGESVSYSSDRMNLFINTVHEVSLSCFNCFMISRTAFDSVGGFDTSFYGKATVADLSVRLMQRGYSNIYTPYSVIHGISDEYNTPCEQDRQRAYDSLRYLLKNGDPYFSPSFSKDSTIPTVKNN